MSTFFGIFNRNRRFVEDESIHVMVEALSYWDADMSGEWKEGSVFLAHRMLWNTPESKYEHLPRSIVSEKDRLVISIDVRLDNRKILLDQLNMSDHPIEKITDSDLVLAAYIKWGESCPQYLLGDFSFVIWDAGKEQLFCVRDHIGIKPFYYHLSDEVLVFSNDIRAVIAHPEVSKQYNESTVARFLTTKNDSLDPKNTFFKAIQKLPAATTLTISHDRIVKSVYWSIDNIPKVHYDTYDQYVDKLRDLLLGAVKVRLRTIYPVASHLSGGLDSSSIAVLASRELKKGDQKLYTFNWTEEVPDGEFDSDCRDWAFARQITDIENMEQINCKLSAEFIAKLYEKVDISIDDSTLFFGEFLIRNEAEQFNIRTLLSGWGGDDLISYNGYAYLSGLFWQGNLAQAVQEVALLYQDRNYKYLRILKRSLREMIYPILYKRMTGLYQDWGIEPEIFECAQEQFALSLKKNSNHTLEFRPGAHNEQKTLFCNGHILERVERWSSAAFKNKLEYSYPLLDKRIVEFALSVPEELYAMRNGHQRYLFRSAISTLLPREITWIRKNSESEYAVVREKLEDEALKIWMTNYKKRPENQNSYVDRSKIFNRLKVYFYNKQNGIEDDFGSTIVGKLIVLSNLKEKV